FGWKASLDWSPGSNPRRQALLEKETRLRTDDDAGADSGDDSESVSSSEEDEEGLGRGADTTTHGGRRGIDGGDWRLDPDDSPDAPDGLYSNGLKQLATELDQKYELDHISSISYTLAVDLNCLDADDPEQKLQHGGRELYVARAALVTLGSCCRGNEGQHELLERRCGRSVVRLLSGVQQHQADNPVQSRGSPSDVGIATAALTLPESAAKGSARVRAI
ncbi:hypothetical protein V502_02016, partial [Pseudogymnoascus sp. VKM F-4520 (FW-2644)]